MFDPFANWRRFVASGISIMETNARVVETMRASSEVIAARSAVIRSTMRSPMSGDYAELGRMVPEKIDAFSQAASVMVSAWWSGQSAWFRHLQDLGAVATSGRPATFREINALNARSAEYVLKAIEAGAHLGRDSLAPIHRGATANAKRLRRTKFRH